MPGLLDFLSRLWNDYNLIIAIVVIVVLDYFWSRFAKSERGLRFAISVQPKSAEAHYKLGAFLAGKPTHIEEAEKEVRQALELNPHLWMAYHTLSSILSSKEVDEKELEELYSQMLIRMPNDPGPYWFRGFMLTKQGLLPQAEQAYRQAITLAPGFEPVYEYLGFLLRDQERFSEAQEVFQKAIALGPSNAAEIHHQLAYIFEKLEKYSESEKEYRRVIALQPKNIDAYQKFTGLLKKQKRYQDVEKLLKKGIKINPKEAMLKVLLAYNLQGNESKVRELLNEIGLLESNSPITFYLIGNLYCDLKSYSEAEMAYRNAMIKDPTFVDAYIGLGVLFADLGKYKESEELYHQAININSKDVWAVFSLGLLYLEHLKRYEDADNAFQKAIELDSEDESAFYNIACCNSLLHNKDRALEYLKKASEKGSNPAHAWEDPDLEWIRDDPRFLEIVGPKPKK